MYLHPQCPITAIQNIILQDDHNIGKKVLCLVNHVSCEFVQSIDFVDFFGKTKTT